MRRFVPAEVEERFVDDEAAAERDQALREAHEFFARKKRPRRIVRVAEHDGFGFRLADVIEQRVAVDGEAAFFAQQKIFDVGAARERGPFVLRK